MLLHNKTKNQIKMKNQNQIQNFKNKIKIKNQNQIQNKKPKPNTK